ncbi:MAG: alpha-amylase family glycosyl hydrolase [Anaerolineaceae bacterium]
MKAGFLDLHREASRVLTHLLPRLEQDLDFSIQNDPQAWQAFTQHLETHFDHLFQLYYLLYGKHYDMLYHLENLLKSMAQASFERPADLRELDRQREQNPLWFQSNQMLGGVCYVDLFAGNLEGIRAKIPYFKELGLTYLHLMPLFKMPERENDGGYAVSSFREVHPPLGTMTELAQLSRDLRAEGISLVLDLVINHTSDEHEWALKAKAGDPDYRDMYFIFPDRTVPDLYEKNLREIFPDEHPGAFTWFEDIKSWVWTTFHSYQWDLDYSNPVVFNRMSEEMLFLANQGVEIFRLDAVAFIWKKLGTSCENLPEAHTILQGFNAITRVVAPSILFKSEAIVHPDEVIKYISPVECQLSYNPLLMALLWNSLATREVNLLSQALEERFDLPQGTAWVNYVRCHDDIGWTFSDEDAARLGINGYDHRRFLNEFYRGRFTGSFARGVPFQENPKTGDCRISGTCASLAGLEKALTEEGPEEVELAIKRILLLHFVVMTAGGIPLIYLGDEIATLNDYGYLEDPKHKNDSRWVHRLGADPERYSQRTDANTLPGRVFQHMRELIELRKSLSGLAGGKLEVIDTRNGSVLGFVRLNQGERLLILANFSEREHAIPERVVQENMLDQKSVLFGKPEFSENGTLWLPPYACVVFG